MLPRMFGEDLFDDFFNNDFMRMPARHGHQAPAMMKTDVRELDGAYELDVDLPGYKKEDVKVDLKDGTLTISASQNTESSDKDDNGKLIRQERYVGNCKRSFYVGDINPNDISAKYEDGTLKLTVPKFEKQVQPSGATIAIE